MSGYLLDTPIVTAYLRGRPAAVALVAPWMVTRQAGTSVVVYGEGIEYLRSFSNPLQWQAALRGMLRQVRVYDLTYAILERYADLRRARVESTYSRGCGAEQVKSTLAHSI
jgi:predicted nucleic acid-binding protein